MNVRKITLQRFTSHDATTIELPLQGLVCITGENGAGKSSVIEGVAYAGWGKTLRGTAPWRGDAKDGACLAAIQTETMNISRSRVGKQTKLEWEDFEGTACDAPGASHDDPEFDTPTKAQEALASLLGPFDLWRRCSVFSTADAAHFTLASDGDRKKLIESFLGLNRFDPALARCREAQKRAVAKVADLTRRKEVGAAKLDAARTRLKEAKQALAAAKAPPAPPEPVAPAVGAAPDYAASMRKGLSAAALEKALATAKKEVASAREQLRAAERAGDGHDSAARVALALLERLRADACPTCAQAIPSALRVREQSKADQSKALAEQARAKARASSADAATLIEELEEEIAALQTKSNARIKEESEARAAHNARQVEITNQQRLVQQAKDEAARYEKQRAILEKALREADDAIGALTTELVTVEESLDAAVIDEEELSACETVLGLKGVRAHVLGKSLGGIEAVANSWLARLHPGIRIALRPYAELKKGGHDDSISVEVTGIGHDLGYRASSNGERKRLDVAMLLAMAEVSSAARGVQTGTLFFDEVLDGLDEAGVAAVAETLQEMARERCVVVITHSRALVDRLPNATKIRITNGAIERAR